MAMIRILGIIVQKAQLCFCWYRAVRNPNYKLKPKMARWCTPQGSHDRFMPIWWTSIRLGLVHSPGLSSRWWHLIHAHADWLGVVHSASSSGRMSTMRARVSGRLPNDRFMPIWWTSIMRARVSVRLPIPPEP